MSNPIINRRIVLSKSVYSTVVVYDTDAQNYFDYCALSTPISTARKTIYNDLFVGLKADGNYSKLDRLGIFASEVEDPALIDLITPGGISCISINSPVWAVDQGYTGDGASAYIETSYNPFSDGINFIQNSASIGTYSRTNLAELSVDAGVTDVSNYTQVISKLNDNNAYGAINTTADYATTSVINSLGLTSIVRSGASLQILYKNGVSIATGTTTSTIPVNGTIYLLCRDTNGVPTLFSNKQIACFFVGSGTINQLSLYNRIQTFMTAIGSQV